MRRETANTVLVLALLGFAALASFPAWGSASQVVSHDSSWTDVRDDAGNWGGDPKGITHQCDSGYWAGKVLDLSNVPAEIWEATTEVRLSAYFCVGDYSWHSLPQANGLDGVVAVDVPMTDGKGPLDLASLPADGRKPVQIKLMDGARLADACTLPN